MRTIILKAIIFAASYLFTLAPLSFGSITFDVQIRAYTEYDGIYEGGYIGYNWSGSGSIIEKLGRENDYNTQREGILILTNEHVIHNSYDYLRVIMFRDDENSITNLEIDSDKVEILYMDYYYDLGLLFISRENLLIYITDNEYSAISVIRLLPTSSYNGFYRSVNIDDSVTVIGNPIGMQHDRSKGFISKLKEYSDLRLLNKPSIHTDAAINSGNSGGAMINTKGFLVGVPASGAEGESMGYAIPLNQVYRFLEDAKKYLNNETVTHGFLFIRTRLVTSRDVALLGVLDISDGEIVTSIKDDSKNTTELKVGDIVTKITGEDGEEFIIGANEERIEFVMYLYKGGSTFTFDLYRNGQHLKLREQSLRFPIYELRKDITYVYIKELRAYFENIPFITMVKNSYTSPCVLFGGAEGGSILLIKGFNKNFVIESIGIRIGDKIDIHKISSVTDLKKINFNKLNGIVINYINIYDKIRSFVTLNSADLYNN